MFSILDLTQSFFTGWLYTSSVDLNYDFICTFVSTSDSPTSQNTHPDRPFRELKQGDRVCSFAKMFNLIEPMVVQSE